MTEVNPIDMPRGAAHVSKGGQTLWARASGFRQLSDQLPNRLDTAFPTASAGKAFVAAGILRLIEEGQLSFESALSDFDGLTIGCISKSVTVHTLLTHTSGIPDYFDESTMDDYEALWHDFPNYRVRSNADLLPLFINRPMQYEPGARFQYNNSGYVILALIIEQVAGVPFDRFLETRVFGPLSMTHTGYYSLDELPGNCASAYLKNKAGDRDRSNIYCVDAKGTGAGGAFTTVLDVKRFWRGLAQGDLFSRSMFERMKTPQTPEGEYGYGLWIRKDGALRIEGMDPGVTFVSMFDPVSDVVVTAVSNFGDDVWTFGNRLFYRARFDAQSFASLQL